MRFLVLVKQVPELDSVRFLPQLNRIERSGVAAMCNPLDRSALEHALALRRAVGGEVVAVTMGPPEARTVLAEVLSSGADRAVHLLDLAFAGADTLATARALAVVVERERPDVVLCGRSTLDGATAQVGPQLAELSGLAQVTQAVEIAIDAGHAEVVREVETGFETQVAQLPVLLTVERGPARTEATPGTSLAEKAVERLDEELVIEELDAEKLGGDAAGYGIRGSGTYVQRVIELETTRRRETVDNPLEGASRLAELLAANGAELPSAQGTTTAARRAGAAASEIWVVVEGTSATIEPASRGALACANAVADRLEAIVVAVVLGEAAGELPAALGAAGADRVLVGASSELRSYSAETYTAALCHLLAGRRPLAVLGPWSSRTRDWLPRVAARLGLGMTGDFVGLDVEPRPGSPEILDLVWLKPAWAGTALARVVARTTPSLGTLRPGSFAPMATTSPPPRVETVDLGELPRAAARAAATIPGEVAPVAIDGAARLVLIGEQLDREEARLAGELAVHLGAALAGTRRAVAAGLVAPQSEVSGEKRSIAPALAIALGVREAGELVAVKMARVIVTVHEDRAASAHAEADLAVVTSVGALIDAVLHAQGSALEPT